MTFNCPVCYYDKLPYPPVDYHICPCCGTEFGNDDVEYTYAELRQSWINGGGQWFFGQPPDGWNPWAQLASNPSWVLTESAAVANVMEEKEDYAVA